MATTTDPRDTRDARERRTLALLHTAADRAASPEIARDWLHTPRRELGGLTPAAAAWLSEALAVLAYLLL